ncbi:phosphoribosylglycinamide formyltransferase [Methanogenium organophilum]|uniref:phosphoribosylglycinamide formyltransferase 1 n=1 Tax=Methanogenium organophilum TaxID=2199 RepID=A0A9X9S6G2_METOG|nr:phosphoribosylglycinamide formyltransferase [Methanogenium organophilum]WAI02598.1 phosphoribosylglycinamide formyltransferase [Methanogenium organophilum]
MKRIAVLASGRGSNFQAIIDKVSDGTIPAEIVCLITDNPSAYAIERAGNHNIPVSVISFSDYPDREQYNQALEKTMIKCGADLFVLAGYMRLLKPETVRTFSGKMINIHPALLPSFSGLHAQKQALDYGVKIAGCTVHFVDEGMDTGPIILQSPVVVLNNDTEDSLAERIMEFEHQALPHAVKLFCEDRLEIDGRRVIVHDTPSE